MSLADRGGGGGEVSSSQVPQYDGTNAMSGIRFITLMTAHIESQRPRGSAAQPLPLQQLANLIARGFPQHSPAARFHQEFTASSCAANPHLPPSPVAFNTYLLETLLWCISSPDKFPERIVALLRHVAEVDLDRSPADLLSFIVSSRTAYYEEHPRETCIVTDLNDNDEPIKRRNTPQEQARRDSYTAAACSSMEFKGRFKLQDADLEAVAITAKLEEIIAHLPEHQAYARQALERRQSRLHSDDFIDFTKFYFEIFQAQLCRAASADHLRYEQLRPNPSRETLEAFTARFTNYDLLCTPTKPRTMMEKVNHYINCLAIFDSALAHAVDSYIANQLPHGQEPTLVTVANQAARINKQIQSRRDQAALSRLPSDRSSAFPSSARAASPPPRASASRSRQVHFSAFAAPSSDVCRLCDRPHHGRPCFVVNPHLAPDTWYPPRDPQVYDIYVASCNARNITPKPATRSSAFPSSRPAASSTLSTSRPTPSRQQYSASSSYNRVPPSSSAAQTHTSHLAAAVDQGILQECPPESTRDEEDAMWHGCHMLQASEGVGFMSLMAVTRSQAATPTTLPATASEHTAPAPTTEAPAATPAAVQRLPAPRPFAQNPVRRGIPASSLPDPTRQARDRLQQASPPAPLAALLPATSSAPAPALATAAESALTASITYLAAQGPGVLEQMMLDSTYMLADLNGTTIRIPIANLRLPMTLELLGVLLQDSPAPLESTTTPHTATALCLHEDGKDSDEASLPELQSLTTESDASELELPSCTATHKMSCNALHTPAAKTVLGVDFSYLAPKQGSADPNTSISTHDSLDELPCTVAFTNHPDGAAASTSKTHTVCTHTAAQHSPLAPFTRKPVIVMRYPAVYSLLHERAEAGVSLVNAATGDLISCPINIVDSGSNMIITTLAFCKQHNLQFSVDDVTSTATSSGAVTSTLGKITTPLDIVLCKGTEHQMSLRLPIHVMGGRHSTFELLLGTPWLNAIGAVLDTLNSTLTYCPLLQCDANSWITHTIPLTTTTNNPSVLYQQDLTNPTPVD
jgi:hypothetical protein